MRPSEGAVAQPTRIAANSAADTIILAVIRALFNA